MRPQGARLAVVLVHALTATACGGGGGGSGNSASDLASDRPLATGLMLLSDEPALRRHVLVFASAGFHPSEVAVARGEFWRPSEFAALCGVPAIGRRPGR